MRSLCGRRLKPVESQGMQAGSSCAHSHSKHNADKADYNSPCGLRLKPVESQGMQG